MTALRMPLLLWLVLSSTASLAASGRVSLRLLFDTGIALGPIPLIQFLAFTLVYWTGARPVGFGLAADRYFAGSRAWFAALTVVGAFGAVVSPVVAAQWFSRLAMLCGLAAIVVSARVDFTFFRDGLARGGRRAAADVIVQRGLGWSATVLYLLATALPKAGGVIPHVATQVFGARP